MLRKLAVAGAIAGGVIGGGVVAMAAGTPTAQLPSAAPAAAPAPDHRGGPGPGIGKRGNFLHGESVVKNDAGQYETHAMIRGEVTAVSATSITVKAEDGVTWTYAVNADTEVRKHEDGQRRGAEAAIADVKVGDTAHVGGLKSGETLTARHVHVHTE